MTSSTTRAFMAKKQSTSFTQVATNLLNVLQRYTKGIRFTAILTVLFTLGVGSMLGAALEDGYEKVTDISTLSAGDRVVLYCDAISLGVTGANSNGKDATVAASDWVEYVVEAASGGVYLKDENASNYIASPGSSNVFKYGTKAVCSVDANGVLKCNNRYLCYNSTGGTYYRMYASIGDYKPFYVYKVVTSTPVYNITVSSNDDSWGTANVSGNTITADPADCYQVKSGIGGYTIKSGTATVTHEGNSNILTVNASTDCSIQVNFEKKPVNTYIDNVQENEEQELCGNHSAPSLADKASATTGTCEQQHWHFMGWVTEANKENPTGNNIVKAGASVTANGTTYYAVWAKGVTSGGASTSKQYSFDITPSNFNGTSYAANNNEKTSTAEASDNSTLEVKWTSNQVMLQNNAIQWQKSKGYIYNSTDLGTINSVTVTSTAGTYTTYYGQSEQPSSGTAGDGKGYFKTSVGSATGTASKVTVTFTITTQGGQTTTYSDYITQCSTQTTITLDPNGGTGNVSTYTTEETSYTLPACPFSRTGYTFAGWAKSINGEIEYGDKANLTNLDGTPVVLYAQWTANSYTVIFNANGGTGEMDNQSFNYDEEKALSANEFTRKGYAFVNWNNEYDGSGDKFANEQVVENLSAIDNFEYNLYAQWECVTPTISTQPQSATYIQDDVADALSVVAAASDATLTYQWQKSTDNSTWSDIIGATEATYKPSTQSVGTTYYQVVVTNSEGNCSATSDVATITVRSANCKWVETEIGDIESGDEVVITMTKGNYVWTISNAKNTASAPNATDARDDVEGQYLTKVNDGNKWVIEKNNDSLTFYSYTDNANYLYCTNADNGNGVRVGTGAAKVFVVDGNYLKNIETTLPRYLGVSLNTNPYSWRCYTANDGVIANQTLKFYKKVCLPENEYWVTYDLENVTCTTTPKVETVTSTSEGFDVTFEAADGYILTDDIEVQMEGGTLETKWVKDKGELMINKPDGGFTGNITISLAACLSLPAPENLAETDLTSSSVTLTWDAVAGAQHYEVFVTDFDKQNITRSNLTECQVTISELTKNTEFTWDVRAIAEGYCGIPSELGYFQTLQTYDVTFNNNGHTNAELMPATQTVDDGSLAQEPADDPSDNGYSFGGWYDNKNCEGDPFNFSETLITDYTVLYAKWNIVTYNITYAGLEGATNHANNPATYTIETPTITFLAPSTRSGYIFSGWNPTTLEKGSYGNKTITATWEKGKIVTWKADDNVIEQQTYASGDKLVLPTEEIEACQGSAFMGWTAAKDYFNATTAPTYVTAGSSVTTDAIYYAVYAEVIGESDEVTMQYTDASTTNMTGENDAATIGLDASEWSVIARKGESSNFPGLNKDGTIRLYYNANGSNYITITSSTKTINNIEITYKNSYNEGLVIVEGNTVSGEELSSDNSVQTVKYPINSDEFVIKNGHTSGSQEQVRITQVLIQTGTTTYTNYSTTCTPTYYITYDLNDGEGGCENGSVPADENYTICANIPTKTGYDFVGWSTADDNEAEFLKEDVEAGKAIIENVSNNVELYAVWEANTYKITWWSNGVEYTTTSHTFDTELQLPADPYTCYGAKTFVGWTEADEVSEDGVGILYIDENTNPSDNKTYYAVFADETGNGSGGYDKVTEALDDYSGEYLIVYEAGNKAFNGGLSTLDATSNGIDVTIKNNTIESNQTTDAAKFTIAVINDGYSIKSASGKYIGRTANENELDESTSTIYTNTISINNDKSINIIGSGSAYLRYNTDGSRFRYYKSSTYSSQQVIALYKKSAGATLTNYTTTPTGCPEIEVAENAYVTSTSSQSVKVKVPVTISNYQDGISLSASIEGESNFTIANISSITEGTATLEIAYKPTDYNTTENTTVTILTKIGENKVTATDFTISGRSLPENFLIATKVGATWYALPANMNGATNPEGVVIDVDETTMTATAPNTTVYTLFPVATVNGNSDRYKEYGERLRFAAVNNDYKGLWANDAKSGTTINNDAKITAANSTAGAAYEWKITTTIVDGNWQYTLQTDQDKNKQYLRYWVGATGAPKWGTYAAGNNQLYFLPVTETEPFDYKVVEWYPTKMLIQTDAAIANPTAKIGDAPINNVTCTNKGSKLYEIAGLPLESNPTKVLTIKFSDGGNNYTNATAIPVIISRSKTNMSGEPFVTLTKDVYNYADLVVRDGATLTIDGGTHAENTFFNVTIYPTSKISVPSDEKLTVHSLTFFGGIDEIYNGSTYDLYKYGVPELSLKGTLYKSIAKMDYVMRVDLNQMYSLTVPYDVQLADIKYWDGSNIALGTALYVSAYDGEERANQSEKTWIYETDFESRLGAATLKAGVGYTISAELQAGVGNEYSILRMPMMSNVASGATEAAKTVAVTAWGKDANVTANHKGWNLVGNPYMTTIQGADDADLVLGYLKETGTGPWEWVDDGIRYVTIPSDDGTYYWQQKFTTAELPPFKNFFVQVGTTGELVFDLGTRQSMPARSTQAAIEKEVEFEILMSNDARQDNTGLLISEEYSPAYEINADLEKMTGSMSVYTIYGGYKLAYNALSPINVSEWIPMGYIAPTAGEYTFRIDDVDKVIDQVAHIYLIDYTTNTVTDLMVDEYQFATLVGTNDTRFAINVILNSRDNTTTGLGNIKGDDDQPIKFIYQDKMYIHNNGIIYDATGKQVTTINK